MHKVAKFNGKTTSFAVEELEGAGTLGVFADAEAGKGGGHDTRALGAVRPNLAKLSLSHLRCSRHGAWR